MGKGLAIILGAVLGFCVGALAGTLAGTLWITVFPPDRIAEGPEAGFGTVIGFGIAGEAIGIVGGIILALRGGSSRT